MSGHTKWRDELSDWFNDRTPEARAAYEKAKAEMDAAWKVECRYGNCIVFVSADSNQREDLGGWGPVGCPCGGEDAYCPDDE
jgi:hypothetical protein